MCTGCVIDVLLQRMDDILHVVRMEQQKITQCLQVCNLQRAATGRGVLNVWSTFPLVPMRLLQLASITMDSQWYAGEAHGATCLMWRLWGAYCQYPYTPAKSRAAVADDPATTPQNMPGESCSTIAMSAHTAWHGRDCRGKKHQCWHLPPRRG